MALRNVVDVVDVVDVVVAAEVVDVGVVDVDTLVIAVGATPCARYEKVLRTDLLKDTWQASATT